MKKIILCCLILFCFHLIVFGQGVDAGISNETNKKVETSPKKKVNSQPLKTIYDGRIQNVEPSKPSDSDKRLIERYALPKTRQIWRNTDVCQENFETVSVTNGSFTKAGAFQRAVLYRFCVTGHDFANNGIAIIEGENLVANVVYEGGEDYAISSSPDINSNGLTEIIISDGSSHQGYSISIITLIEISRSGVKNFGYADVYQDDCGAKEPCKTFGYKILVEPGQTPIFYRETYSKKNEKWIKVSNSNRYSFKKSLREPAGIFRLLN